MVVRTKIDPIRMVWMLVLIMGLFLTAHSQEVVSPLRPIDEGRVRQIETMLSDIPAGYGDPCSERKIWDQLMKSGKYEGFLKGMGNFSFPPFSKKDYFSLSDGSASSSAQGLTMMRNRAAGLSKVTWAECLENKGRFTPIIVAGLQDIIQQPSWVSPRNDYDFKNYKGLEYAVELTSALYAHTIAQTLYMMGNKLPEELRREAVEAIRKRVFEPVLHKINTQNKERENAFLLATNNYNHVCLSGVVGAALTVLKDKHERAVFAYIGEYYSKNGISGFADDGYCSEGITYYNYGFGHYVLLRESLLEATSGKLDLFVNPKVAKIARYGADLQIINGVYPAISDSPVTGSADSLMMSYLSRNLHLGLMDYENCVLKGKTDNNRLYIILAFSDTDKKQTASGFDRITSRPIRSYFEQSGVLILRPEKPASPVIGLAMKGGNNQEHHNHNDVGSYTLVQGKDNMMGDPGSIPYTADIFNPQTRYTYKTVGSYGHPVPLVAGQQQQAGATARAIVKQSSFNDQKDVFEIDYKSAYPVTGLKKLTRKLTYDRASNGQAEVVDQFEFDAPKAFETALITRAHWKQLPDDQLMLEGKDGKILVSIQCPGNTFTLHTEQISEGGKPYTRIGIALERPALLGKIIVSYKPIK